MCWDYLTRSEVSEILKPEECRGRRCCRGADPHQGSDTAGVQWMISTYQMSWVCKVFHTKKKTEHLKNEGVESV